MQSSLAVTAVLMGLAGGPHCVAMCGAACAGLAQAAGPRQHQALTAFQIGRLTGYSVLGAVAAGGMQALGFPIALANVTGYVISGLSLQELPPYAFGYLWLPALVVISCCSVFMAPIGASTAHKLPVKQLKRVFAGMLYVLAGYMLFKGLSS